MRIKDAKKLHNGDEVIEKSTGKSIKVFNTWLDYKKLLLVEGLRSDGVYMKWTHQEVK